MHSNWMAVVLLLGLGSGCFKPALEQVDGVDGDDDGDGFDGTAEEVGGDTNPTAETDTGGVETDATASDTADTGDGVVAECSGDGECTRLSGLCKVGRCEAGRCVARDADGTCDDGNKCTTADRCDAGMCVGDAVVCAAIDQCHEAGACDNETGVCSNPSKDDGTPCDDSDACGVDDECRVGVCAPGRLPDDTAGDLAVGFSGDGSVLVMDMVADLDGDALLLLLVEGQSLRHENSSGESFWTHTMPVGAAQSLVLVRMDPDTLDPRPPIVLGHTSDTFGVDAVRGLAILADGSLVISGYFNAETTLGADTTIGVSPSGFAITEGVYVARMTRAADVLWHREYFGVPRADPDEIGTPKIVLGAGMGVLHSVFVEPSQLLEIVADGDTEETLLPRDVGYSLVEELALDGAARVVAYVRTTSAPGGAYVAAVSQVQEGFVVLGGTFAGGSTELVPSWESAPTKTIPTGVSVEPESWVAQLGPDGQLLEYRHFWSANADAGVTPFTMEVGQHISVGLLAGGDLRSRSTNAVVESVDSGTPVGTPAGILVSVDRATLGQRWGMTTGGEVLLSRVRAGAGGELVISGYFEDRFEPSPANGSVVATEDFSRHGLLLAGVDALGAASFGVSVARPTEEFQSLFDGMGPLPFFVTADGAYILAGTVRPNRDVGVTAKVPPTTSTRQVAFVLRLNSEGALECPDTAP